MYSHNMHDYIVTINNRDPYILLQCRSAVQALEMAVEYLNTLIVLNEETELVVESLVIKKAITIY